MTILSATQLRDMLDRCQQAAVEFADAAAESARANARRGRDRTIDLNDGRLVAAMDAFDDITDAMSAAGLADEANRIWTAAHARLDHAVMAAAIDPWAGPEAVPVGAN